MFPALKRFLNAPTFVGEEKTRVAELLHAVLWMCLTGAIAFLVIVALSPVPYGARDVILTALVIPFSAGALWLLRLGYVRTISLVLTIGLWLVFALASLPDAGVMDPAYPGFVIAILVGTFLLGTPAGIVLAVLSGGLGLVMLYMNAHGLLTSSPEGQNLAAYWGAQSIYFFVATLVIHLATRHLNRALNRAHRTEVDLQRINRAYRVLSDCNQTLIRATEESALFRQICQILVEQGGYELAWVGQIDPSEGDFLKPAAYAGQAENYVLAINEIAPRHDPTFAALRSGQTQVLHGARGALPQTSATAKIDAIIALPLVIEGQALGTLSVYAADSEAFDAEESRLLEELAGDLAFGIQTLRTRQAHQRMSDELAAQHALLRTVVDAIPDTIFMKDHEGRYTLVNRAYAELEGTTPQEVIGKTTFDLFPHELARYFHDMDLKHMTMGEPIINFLQAGIHRGTGEKRWFLMNQAFVRDAQGEVTGMVGIGHDITERIQMEEEVRYQANLLEKVSDAVFSTTPDLVIVSWNKAAEHMYGVSAREAIGRRSSDMIATTYEPASGEEILKTITETGSWQGEVVHTTRDGRRLNVLVAASLLRDSQDDVIGIVTVNRDITAQKQIQQALVEQKQMQVQLQKERELNETRNQLTSMVSHEFRVPLAVIQSSTDLLDRYWERMAADKRMEHLRRIRSQVKHLDALVADFSLALHAESGLLKFNPSWMNLELFCRDLVEEFEITVGDARRLNFLFEGVSSDIQADRVLLGHILRNLLSNAIKYSPAGGEIGLELSQTENQVIIRIWDQGIGIPPEDMSNLFEAYHRAGNVGAVPGTGMGLKIVKDCVELHGGDIDVTSELDRGTTFVVTLPATGITSV